MDIFCRIETLSNDFLQRRRTTARLVGPRRGARRNNYFSQWYYTVRTGDVGHDADAGVGSTRGEDVAGSHHKIGEMARILVVPG
jgi:hypothetical protein